MVEDDLDLVAEDPLEDEDRARAEEEEQQEEAAHPAILMRRRPAATGYRRRLALLLLNVTECDASERPLGPVRREETPSGRPYTRTVRPPSKRSSGDPRALAAATATARRGAAAR